VPSNVDEVERRAGDHHGHGLHRRPPRNAEHKRRSEATVSPQLTAGTAVGNQGRVKSHMGATHAFVADQLSMARYPLSVSTQPDGQESKAEVVQGAELILYAEPGSGSPPVPAACIAATHDTRLAPAPAMVSVSSCSAGW
jgi:hypothetical protein